MRHLEKFPTILTEIWAMISVMNTYIKSSVQEQYSFSFPHPFRGAAPHNKGEFFEDSRSKVIHKELKKNS